MIRRFPLRADAARGATAPLLQVASATQDGEEDLAWVGWMFQSARLRCGSLIFDSKEVERAALLEDWGRFVRGIWLPGVAPVMLKCWRAALDGDDETVAKAGLELKRGMSGSALERSVAAGRWLLAGTRGAKHQGALGRYRQKVEEGLQEPHLPVVWALLAALFQLPALDMLTAVLAEEWRAAAQDCVSRAEPQGPLGFSVLGMAALRASGMLGVEMDRRVV